MTYTIVCLLTAVMSAAGTWLLCRYLLSRLGMRELGIKEIPMAVRDIPGEGKYAPRCGGLLPSAAAFASATVMLLLHALLSLPGGASGTPRLSGLQNMYIWGGLLLALLCGAAGFMEDYAVVFRRLRRGLPVWQQLLIRMAIVLAFLAALWLAGDGGEGRTLIPFAGEVQLGLWYYPLSLLLIIAVVRGTELLQEADGAVPMTGFFSFLPHILVAGILSTFNAGMADTGITAIAGACACLVFLSINLHPARVHCGAAGGAFMGALLCAVAFAQRMPLILLLTGGVYIAEAVTDLFARLTERLTGEAVGVPLHCMIGRSGRNDMQITVILAAVTAVAGAAAAALAIFGNR